MQLSLSKGFTSSVVQLCVVRCNDSHETGELEHNRVCVNVRLAFCGKSVHHHRLRRIDSTIESGTC
jgi:hypothetical protein